VWFNVGLYHDRGIPGSEGGYHWDEQAGTAVRTHQSYEHPQASACFIQSVEDNMEDIMRLATSEAMLFKFGSGTGTDMSTLRSSREKLSGGGQPSGPLSFMRIYDQIAAVVRSGGKTRRAAKMQSLRCDHPDIKEFIECKMNEERKAWSLIEQGYDGSFNGDAYGSIMFQNANLSVRLTDEFMQAAQDDKPFATWAVTTGEKMGEHRAKQLLREIAEGTHICGDPGVQYHTTINRWHTCPETDEIHASNPCSEYMFLNDSACNLASLNLMKFRLPDGSFDIERFLHAVRVLIIAQEILVDHASYPTERICRNSHDYRPLGLGYANLGALIMSLGQAYDSPEGQDTAGAITAMLTGEAYATSAELASRLGAFPGYYPNRQPMLKVMKMHRAAVDRLSSENCPERLISRAAHTWDRAIAAGEQLGYRNAQVSVLAPTGTIGFMMDCDTTGIEPDIALVKYKLLAGGGMFKIVNKTVPLALERLGYSAEQIKGIIAYIDEHDTIEGAPELAEEHLPVFDCAFKPANGRRSIHYMGHIRMMAAAQPFISGAISKTVNMPTDATIEDIEQVYADGWKMGLKAIAIYRDGSKRSQPLNTGRKKEAKAETEAEMISREELEEARRRPHRHRLPATRPSVTHKFGVGGHEGYLNVGMFEDGMPGELFITMAKEGSTVGGMMDAFATAISLCLQYGVPLDALVKKFTHQRFEPSGMTSNKEIPFAKSIVDYVFRWMGMTFIEEYRKANAIQRSGESNTNEAASALSAARAKAAPEAVKDDDVSSVPGRAERTPDKEDSGSAGAPLTGRYGSGRNNGGSGEKTSRNVAVSTEPRTSGKTSRRFERVDQQFSHYQEDAPACDVCGSITVRNGNCYKCFNCGSSLGCS
ncbi:MAG: vitamin B12-dependent ribonucleotide reductase, partial [Planctomycetota bacterium]